MLLPQNEHAVLATTHPAISKPQMLKIKVFPGLMLKWASHGRTLQVLVLVTRIMQTRRAQPHRIFSHGSIPSNPVPRTRLPKALIKSNLHSLPRHLHLLHLWLEGLSFHLVFFRRLHQALPSLKLPKEEVNFITHERLLPR